MNKENRQWIIKSFGLKFRYKILNERQNSIQVYSIFKLQYMEHGPSQCAMFPFEPGVASDALIKSADNTASQQGPLVYLNGGLDLSVPLSKVEPLGGQILQDKTDIGEHGFIAFFKDTEGNKVGLHSPN